MNSFSECRLSNLRSMRVLVVAIGEVLVLMHHRFVGSRAVTNLVCGGKLEGTLSWHLRAIPKV